MLWDFLSSSSFWYSIVECPRTAKCLSANLGNSVKAKMNGAAVNDYFISSIYGLPVSIGLLHTLQVIISIIFCNIANSLPHRPWIPIPINTKRICWIKSRNGQTRSNHQGYSSYCGIYSCQNRSFDINKGPGNNFSSKVFTEHCHTALLQKGARVRPSNTQPIPALVKLMYLLAVSVIVALAVRPERLLHPPQIFPPHKFVIITFTVSPSYTSTHPKAQSFSKIPILCGYLLACVRLFILVEPY